MNFFEQTISLKRPEGRHNFFYLFRFKAFGEVLRDDYSGALFLKVASTSICNCSTNEPYHGHFQEWNASWTFSCELFEEKNDFLNFVSRLAK